MTFSTGLVGCRSFFCLLTWAVDNWSSNHWLFQLLGFKISFVAVQNINTLQFANITQYDRHTVTILAHEKFNCVFHITPYHPYYELHFLFFPAFMRLSRGWCLLGCYSVFSHITMKNCLFTFGTLFTSNTLLNNI